MWVSEMDYVKTLQSLATVRDLAAACPMSMSQERGVKAPTSFYGMHGELVKQNLEVRLLSESLNWKREVV